MPNNYFVRVDLLTSIAGAGDISCAFLFGFEFAIEDCRLALAAGATAEALADDLVCLVMGGAGEFAIVVADTVDASADRLVTGGVGTVDTAGIGFPELLSLADLSLAMLATSAEDEGVLRVATGVGFGVLGVLLTIEPLLEFSVATGVDKLLIFATVFVAGLSFPLVLALVFTQAD